MTHTELESIPVTWDDERDGAFFALVRHVFRPDFASGATALLMSYDEDAGVCPGQVARPDPCQRMLTGALPA